MQTGGQVLIDGLTQYGVNTVFCVPGESYLGALDAMYEKRDQVQLIACRQEGGAAYMAEAWGKLTGNPGVCFVSRGPGSSNAMIGIHTAFQDSTPMICFIGQISRGDRGREAFQELDYHRTFSSVAKKVISIDDPDRIPEQLNQAWHTAITGRPGPVIVVLYEDMLREETTTTTLPTSYFSARQHHSASPAADAITAVKSLLDESEKPLVICGDGSWDHSCAILIAELAERYQLPVATAFRRQDNIDNTHPHYVGEFGLVAPDSLTDYLHQADLLIVMGPRLGDITTQGYRRIPVPQGISGQKLVHIHPAAEEMNAVYCADISIVSRCKDFLKAMLGLESAAHDRVSPDRVTPDRVSPDRVSLIETLHQKYLDFVHTERYPEAPVRMDRIMSYLRKRLPADSIITNGAGNYTTWPQRHYQYKQAKTQLASTNGSMGYGVPAAVAAKLARPQSTVVSFSGDGCFLMNGQEISTAVQYQLPIVFLVVNNNRYGTIRTHQEMHYPGRVIGTELRNPDFAALAKAYGAMGFVVTKTAEFEPTFEQALGSSLPVVIEIQDSSSL